MLNNGIFRHRLSGFHLATNTVGKFPTLTVSYPYKDWGEKLKREQVLISRSKSSCPWPSIISHGDCPALSRNLIFHYGCKWNRLLCDSWTNFRKYACTFTLWTTRSVFSRAKVYLRNNDFHLSILITWERISWKYVLELAFVKNQVTKLN